MKTILISTDFSQNAAHAAAYGYNLAKQIKANIVLVNAITVPAETPQAGMIVWPMYEENEFTDESIIELKKLKTHLEENDYSDTFKPTIDYLTESGKVTDVVEHFAKEDVGLIIAGNHASDGLSTFLLGNHCNNLIDRASKPLLVISPKSPIIQIKKIAFATDFNHIGKDLDSIYELISFARLLNAEILLTHIYTEDYDASAVQPLIDKLMTDLSNKADYPNIYYRAVKATSVKNGLDWLCEHGQIDILAMNHGPHSFINDIFNLSHTQNMAAHTSMPILVYQAGS
jgi:nucleotide-binding universal stress UspA family protein